jgi:hypothetical protein
MSQANHALTMTRAPATMPAASSPPSEYPRLWTTDEIQSGRRLAYRMFRTEGVRRSDGRLYRLAAVTAWRLARQFPSPSLGRRYAEALS